MRIVLQALAERFDLSAADARPERMIRRAIISSPDREGEIVARAGSAVRSDTSALAA